MGGELNYFFWLEKFQECSASRPAVASPEGLASTIGLQRIQ
jgi:hypothetical protein